MARRGSGSGLWLLFCGILFVAMIPREIWIGLIIISAIVAAIFGYVKWKAQSPSMPTPVPQDDGPTLAELMARSSRSTRPPAVKPSSKRVVTVSTIASAAELYTAAMTNLPAVPSKSYAMPKPPVGYGEARWLSSGEVIEVAGTSLPGGLFYVGTELVARNGGTDPCLINPGHNVARQGEFTERQTSYWPSYSDISPSARRAYLNWLSDGRSHPECDVGYVFLFFYGMERRVIVDTPNDPSAKRDWPTIAGELRRLLDIYGERSSSFRRYAAELLDWIELDAVTERLYVQPIPSFPQTYELPRYLRLALGQSAVDRAPIPAHLALAWVRLDPGIYLRTAATRCSEEFERLFTKRYHEILGPGLVLPKNRTRLKFVYQPASSGLHGAGGMTRTFGDVPDVTILTAPLKTLQDVVNQCTDELSAFSRAVGKDPGARDTLDGLLLLPASLWPAEARQKLQSLISRMQGGMLTQKLGEVIEDLGGATQSFNRDKVRSLARALAALQVGMEPDVLAGAKAPGASDPIVLFSMPASEPHVPDSAAYQAATLTLQLASAVAQADGEFDASEVSHLRTEIQNWSHLAPAHQLRLHAHLQWLVAAPVTLTTLKKKLEPLELQAREAIAAFMATLAQADGVVSPDEVKFLQKVYKALGVEAKRVFGDLHAVTVGVSTATRLEKTGFRLDSKRIAELQHDTEKVTALLASIFKEEDIEPAQLTADDSEKAGERRLLGLDEAHATLARLLLSRPQWTRSELLDAAADLELMLDGALETINEASFDAYDQPLAEGEDPVDINAEVLEKIET